ncbi:MAG: hypothetical protein ACD_11C00015G0001 [uncultured bacterium]|nr:MAG: hypothetical protein ACD_11C00015G0001 [uncultured bacterium]
MQKLKKNLPLVVIIGILFATGMVFANTFSQKSQSMLGVSVALGEDDENGSDEANEREDSDDNDRDEDENDREDENKNDNEDGDKEDEQKTNRTRTSTQVRTQEANDDDEDEDKDEIDEADEEADDLKENVSELNKDIRKVELKISVLSANGIAVDSFNNNLGEVRGLVAQAEALAVSNPKGAEDILENAEHKLERLSKLVKMSLKDDDEDEESTEEAIEEIGELKRDIAKIEAELNTASASGIDVTSYRTILNEVKDLLSQAEEKLSAGNYIEAEALAELAGKKLDKIDDVIEDLDEDDEDDDDVAKEYKNEVAQFVHNLKTIGEIEGGIGQQVRVVAQAQNDSEAKVENSINEVNSRGGFAKFLIGPKYGNIAEVKTAITENQTRVKVLTELMNQLTDPAVKLVLQDQITILNQQNANLQNFVESSESGVSLLGWLMRMFS